MTSAAAKCHDLLATLAALSVNARGDMVPNLSLIQCVFVHDGMQMARRDGELRATTTLGTL
jgi:hypothetical protein